MNDVKKTTIDESIEERDGLLTRLWCGNRWFFGLAVTREGQKISGFIRDIGSNKCTILEPNTVDEPRKSDRMVYNHLSKILHVMDVVAVYLLDAEEGQAILDEQYYD